MFDQTYTLRSLERLMTKGDPKRYQMGRDKCDYRQRLSDVRHTISEENFVFSTFKRAQRNQKLIYIASSLEDDFALRKLNRNLSAAYSVKQADRHAIVQQIKQLLKDRAPFYVTRCDIQSFYESIQREELLRLVLAEQRLCFRSALHLEQLLGSSRYFDTEGLPRGLGISSTLSEILLRAFDAAMRSHVGVYYYARYVDDIIIFSHVRGDVIRAAAAVELNKVNLALNAESMKNAMLSFDKKGKCDSIDREFSYLGYRFVFSSNAPLMHVRIAERKISKIKQRIMRSFFQYLGDRNFDNLKDRLAFLTGNVRIRSRSDNRMLMAGIHYNYALIDEQGYEDLDLLTRFLRRALHAKRGAFGRRMSASLSARQRTELMAYCFRAGFTKRIRRSFDPERIREITNCWEYA